LSSPVLGNKSPFEVIYKHVRDLLNLRAFGYVCFAFTVENNKNKFHPRLGSAFFLGFKFGTKEYVVININTRELFVSRTIELFVSRNVVFHDHTFPKTDKYFDQEYFSYRYKKFQFCL